MKSRGKRRKNGKRIEGLGVGILLLMILNACSQAPSIRLALAASLLPPLEEIAASYKQATGQEVALISASSGVLTAQIEAGAPYDLFLSADEKYTQYLTEKGLGLTPPKALPSGMLVCWTKGKVDEAELSAYLLGKEVHRIALADTELAPYGRQAIAFLEKKGLKAQVSSKLVFGENVSHTNMILSSGTVEAAFSSNSACINPSLSEANHWIRLKAFTTAQYVTRLQDSPQIEAFWQYLFGPEARQIFEKYGYF